MFMLFSVCFVVPFLALFLCVFFLVLFLIYKIVCYKCDFHVFCRWLLVMGLVPSLLGYSLGLVLVGPNKSETIFLQQETITTMSWFVNMSILISQIPIK